MMIYKYDTSRFNFHELLLDHFGCSDLQKLHEAHPDWVPDKELSFAEESSTQFHNSFYEKLREPWTDFVNLYKKFIAEQIGGHVCSDCEFIFQSLPSFRVHLPNEKAIHKVHYDSDDDHRHPPGEVNVFLPMTECLPENTLWAESQPGRGDFSPMLLKHGEYAVWDGNKCAHHNKTNTEGLTRVSLDFRLLLKEDYDPTYERSSFTSTTKFLLGEYYSEL